MRLTALPAFDDNLVWCLIDDTGRAIVVDPGDATPVLDAARDGLVPSAVLLTHHHHDHIGGVPALLDRWPELPVFAPDDVRIEHATQRVGDAARIEAGGVRFDVMFVPGHTRSHVAFVGAGSLFCGDTLFSLGCGRLFEGTAAQMHASLARLAALDDATRVCCGHEYTESNAAFALAVEPDNPALHARAAEVRMLRAQGRLTLPSTIASERACNPFLRCDAAAVRDRIATRLGHAPSDDVETFAELRRWKDGFRS
ncbi:hydroxyacylglutathione hydrolase [Cognatilysobacter bugurensis]|uniref:Hydroxyacylglutathione hydrolase n=1 Tax=Cognatilysobacter bugurensis TaxID=543356 RepID=A0A918W3S8_9GAMM|nr:hydroxyacylglutathione hydrolase [Lysobacter bugurensis]GHA69644.1 hydroxyacylglutathione hydrolase [Lysobacter bugurensis]